MSLHPEITPLAFLIGTWNGEGRGEYPTITDFTYGEEITIAAPPDKPFLTYTQRTWRTGDHPEAGAPLHTETGYLRAAGPGRAEAVVAMPTGVVEVHAGTVNDDVLRLETTTVGATSTAKEVRSVARTLEVDGDELRYELWMAAVGQENQIHLTATLRRRGPDPFLEAAIAEARLGRDEGGIPIGSVLVVDGEIIGRGHNRRVQQGSPVLHAEIDCLEDAGRLDAATYRRSVLYSTLSPCDMCSGAVLLYEIPRVVVGENHTFQGPEAYVRSRGVEVEIRDDAACRTLMEEFIAANPALWNEDIGE